MQKKSRTNPKNISLIIGICVPIAMILFVAVSIYLPQFFVQPKFDFVYSTLVQKYNTGMPYPTKIMPDGSPVLKPYDDYEMNGNKIVKVTLSYPSGSQQPEIKLYHYDVAENKPREITFDEAQKYNLSADTLSPDGFEVSYGSRGDGGVFPLFYSSSDYDSRYLKGNGVSKKLNLQGYYNDYGGYGSFRFLGWVIK